MEEAEAIGSVAADKQEITTALASLAQKKGALRVDNLYVHTSHLAALEKKALDLIAKYHKDNPLKPGLDKEELKGMLRMRLSPKVLNMTIDGLVKKKQVETDGSKLRLPGFKAAVGKDQSDVKDKIVEAIKKGGTQPPVREELPALFGITDKDAKDLLKLLAEEGRTVRINDSLHLDKDTLETIKADLKKHLGGKERDHHGRVPRHCQDLPQVRRADHGILRLAETDAAGRGQEGAERMKKKQSFYTSLF